MNGKGALGALALALSLASFAAEGQAADRVLTIGIAFSAAPVADLLGERPANPVARAIRDGLRERGWVEGRNVRILWRSLEGQFDRGPAVIEEFVQLPVDVIVTFGNLLPAEAKRRTTKIPIVMGTSSDPARNRLVDSLARPGGNVTGLSFDIGRELHGKTLALLKQAAPHVSRVAILGQHVGSGMPTSELQPDTLATARTLGLALIKLTFRTPDQLESTVADAVRQGADALYVLPGVSLAEAKNLVVIHQLAERYKLPAIHGILVGAESGGLLAYAPDIPELARRVPYYVDRILKGARPADLPIEQPSRYELIVNLKAAKAIGLAIPQSLLVQASRVID